ncbi:MAG: ABC transporter permease, partial [Patescibacteria group bacterium]
SLTINIGRTTLSALGIIIGIASVIALISVGQGAQAKISQNIQNLGSNLIIVTSGNAKIGNVRQGIGTAGTLNQNDLTALESRSNTPDVVAVSPVISKQGELIYKNQNAVTLIEGVTPAAQSVNNITMSKGSFITEPDIKNNLPVIVLGPIVAGELFPNSNPLGKIVTIGNSSFTVIGVTQAKGSSGGGSFNQDNQVAVPITTAQDELFGNIGYSSIIVQAQSAQVMNNATSEVENTLMRVQGITNINQANFSITNQTQILSTLNSITGTFTLLLGGIAGISLIVGGIGIMNIMLVSVTERTREIGLRKAIGAKNSDILYQFLIEAILITIIGGFIGVIIGILLDYVVALYIIKVPFIISTLAIILSISVSITIGLVFGIFPAYKASKLSPIEALRYE